MIFLDACITAFRFLVSKKSRVENSLSVTGCVLE